MIEASFDKARETNSTVRFEEPARDDPRTEGNLYIQTWIVRRLGEPAAIWGQIDADRGQRTKSGA